MFQRKLEEQNKELKSRISSLQQELENSEAVQKDFVRLSQHLQVITGTVLIIKLYYITNAASRM